MRYRVAILRRFVDPQNSITVLQEVTRLAMESGDQLLAACARFLRGHLLCYTGDFGTGLVAMEEGVVALDSLSADDRARLQALGAIGGFTLDTHNHRGTLALRLAGTGRFIEAHALSSCFITQVSGLAANETNGISFANAYRGMAIASAAMGKRDEAQQAFTRARDVFEHLNNPFLCGVTAMQELQWVTLPYLADRPTERERVAAMAERAWEGTDASVALAELPHRFARLYLLQVDGAWHEARTVAEPVYAANGSYKAVAVRVLGAISRDQGDLNLAWGLVRDVLPKGPDTDVGAGNYGTVLLLQRLAATLALDAGDLTMAHRWLESHDRWLAWSGAVLGVSEAHALWTQYHRVTGDTERACEHVNAALAHASDPRQPLALLAAHRLIGELATDAGRFEGAEKHLNESLALADACQAPYERALTLLGIADLRAATNQPMEATTLLDKVRAICEPLGAKPALARADALLARLPPQAASLSPALLTVREVEVLRLVAAGHTNRQIADALSLSPRTIDVHVRNIFAKTGTENRAGATAFAFRHDLA